MGKLIRQIVRPYLEELGLEYPDDTNWVSILAKSDSESRWIEVREYEDAQVLTLTMEKLARVSRPTINLYTLLNRLNQETPGKWLYRDDGTIDYVLDMVVSDDTQPSTFKEHIDCIMDYVEPSLTSLKQALIQDDNLAEEQLSGERIMSQVEQILASFEESEVEE